MTTSREVAGPQTVRTIGDDAARSGAERASSVAQLDRPGDLGYARDSLPPTLTALAVGVVLLALLPLAYLLVRAAGASPAAWGLLLQPRVLAIVANSVLLTLAVTTASIALALPLAWLTTVTDLPGRRAWTVLTALPLVIPSYVGAFAVLAVFGPRGALQELLAPLGVERLPEIYGFFGAWFTLTLFTYPYVLLTLRGAWLRLDGSLEDAARILGHGPWSVWWRVTLPHLRPAIAAGGLLVALYTLSDFGAVSLMRFNAFTQAIFVQYRSSFDRSLAALLALVLVAFTLALLWAEQRTRGRARTSRAGSGSPRPVRQVVLGPWRWPALALVAGVVALGVGLPVGVSALWGVRSWATGESLTPLLRPMAHSLTAAGLAALATTAAALPIALLAARYRHPLVTWLERGSYVGNGLPGITIALSLVFFGARYAPFLYQTLPLLIFGYAVRFLPEAVGSSRASLLQVSPRLEEAARGLGLSPWRAWWRVTWPLARPGIAAGAALVFLTVMKELPITLLLGPTGFKTLATEIWSATAEAFYARAAVPALLLVLASSLSIGLLLKEHER
ncbi:MAG: iron ABC transporter permease [Caldilineales bacterium]|nr:iron ABC transporter permease [Caldilineales bacterium]MDW8318176.1 iron ABC transporter permease [Anaerolineae bacterium]